jgi:hypothetical protein
MISRSRSSTSASVSGIARRRCGHPGSPWRSRRSGLGRWQEQQCSPAILGASFAAAEAQSGWDGLKAEEQSLAHRARAPLIPGEHLPGGVEPGQLIGPEDEAEASRRSTIPSCARIDASRSGEPCRAMPILSPSRQRCSPAWWQRMTMSRALHMQDLRFRGRPNNATSCAIIDRNRFRPTVLLLLRVE